jgi:hypothetical protein
MNRPPILVIADLHLGPADPGGTEAALVALLARHPGCDLVSLGDLFDLSADRASHQARESVLAHVARNATLARAWRSHVLAGRALTLVVGNHDAWLGAPGIRDDILHHLDLPTTSALRIEPWWIRRFDIHLEHGHIWDPDNAPIHPLVATERDTEPLGVALTRHVLAPTRAFQFAHAHETTPLAGLLRALHELRLRAPEVILRYFVTGARIFWRAAGIGHERSMRAGDQAIFAYARSQGLSPRVVERLVRVRPTPRHADPAATFARLFFDRAAATLVAALSTTACVVEHDVGYLLIAALGLLYLKCSRGNRAYRYGASLQKRIESAALGILPIVSARAVVFGHTHAVAARAGYANTGAFGFPTERGRPYLLLQGDQRISRGWVGSDTELEPLDWICVRPGSSVPSLE